MPFDITDPARNFLDLMAESFSGDEDEDDTEDEGLWVRDARVIPQLRKLSTYR